MRRDSCARTLYLFCVSLHTYTRARARARVSVDRINHGEHLRPDIYDIITNISAEADMGDMENTRNKSCHVHYAIYLLRVKTSISSQNLLNLLYRYIYIRVYYVYIIIIYM